MTNTPTDELPKVKTPFTDKKKVKVINTQKSMEWVFKSTIKRNGTLYKGGSVCPKNQIEEMKELKFIKSI